ncbi:MAG: hypothetical protein WCL28_08030 [bacterium]
MLVKITTRQLFLMVAAFAFSSSGAMAKEQKRRPVPLVKPVEINLPATAPARAVAGDEIQAQSRKNNGAELKAWAKFQDLRKGYRKGQINDEDMWTALSKLNDDLSKLTATQRSNILQVQATLLIKAKRPILASIYASQSLIEAQDPLDDEFKRSWQILRDVSRKQPIQNLVDLVAANTKLSGKMPPMFGSEWNYFLGNTQLKQKNLQLALTSYRQLNPGDRYFLPAKFQEAMILMDGNDRSTAATALRTITKSTLSEQNKITSEEFYAIQDHANMALGRILYEDKKFPEAIKHYRMVRRDGNQFYDALFEQSWALFMAGFPKHALGTLYAVRSPFFKETFNPEATMLTSIIYYWMCRYDDSRQELAEFASNHQKAIDDLNKHLAKGITDPNSYYRLFEDTVTGVSSAGLGMPRQLLNMAIEQDNLMFVRDQYASIVAESQKLDRDGIFGSNERLEGPRRYLQKWTTILKEDIGLALYSELKSLKSEYERLYEQGQFLYVELLMSKKDQLLGKELHSSGKLATLSGNDNIRSWGRKTQTWASDNKQEYWADELGFHIMRVEPMCVVGK